MFEMSACRLRHIVVPI